MKRQTSILAALAAGVAVALLALGGWAIVRSRTIAEQRFAHVQAALLRSDDEPTRCAAVQRLVPLHECGASAIVAALDDERPAVFATAAAGVDELLTHCKRLPPAERGAQLTLIAGKLAAIAPQLPASRRRVVRAWAEQLLAWPIVDAETSAGLLVQCQAIIEETSETACLLAEQREALEVARRAQVASAGESALSNGRPAPWLSTPETEPIEVEPPSPTTTPLPLTAANDDPIEQLQPPTLAASAAAEAALAQLSPAIAAATVPPQITSAEPEPERFLAPHASPLPHRIPHQLPSDSATPDVQWRSIVDFEVMCQLAAPQTETVAAAERELARRGYRPNDLALCRALVDPDPHKRRRFAEVLPRMPGVDPRPWLLQLSEDANPDVRQTAVGILSTSRDPEVLQRLH